MKDYPLYLAFGLFFINFCILAIAVVTICLQEEKRLKNKLNQLIF
ncbi:MAG: hypothetical protein QG674_385 [Patescibacteria group bacterium]|jgi:hypothetical protein|nr:hypothetical protein [Patescibacteria group bacterium]